MDLDKAIATATEEVAAEQAASKEAVETPEVKQEEPKVEAQETEEDISKKPDEALTPEQLAKREKNREAHENSKLAKMRRANRELQAELQRLQQAPKPQENQPKPEVTGKPTPDKFETWEDYNEALTDWKLEQKLAENTKKTETTQQSQELAKWADERSKVVDTRVSELESSIPDFGQTLEEIEEFLPPLTPDQARIALEAEDINLAVYALHKEGKLLDVMKLPPSQLAAAIAKAEIRGQQYLKQQKTATNAPTPIAAAKGNTTGGRSLQNQSVDEVMKSLGFRP